MQGYQLRDKILLADSKMECMESHYTSLILMLDLARNMVSLLITQYMPHEPGRMAELSQFY